LGLAGSAAAGPPTGWAGETIILIIDGLKDYVEVGRGTVGDLVQPGGHGDHFLPHYGADRDPGQFKAFECLPPNVAALSSIGVPTTHISGP
jgi:hypothetical protein